jgi:NADPH-dependent 2,4-dienoyl-CoA reductase/sulfur reductase-like enzyme
VHVSVDAVSVMAVYQPVVLACGHCGGRPETFFLWVSQGSLWYDGMVWYDERYGESVTCVHSVHMPTRQVDMLP